MAPKALSYVGLPDIIYLPHSFNQKEKENYSTGIIIVNTTRTTTTITMMINNNDKNNNNYNDKKQQQY